MFESSDRRKRDTLAKKRSFFVRMVSDPKIYNPTIAGALPRRHSHINSIGDDYDTNSAADPLDNDENELEVATPT